MSKAQGKFNFSVHHPFKIYHPFWLLKTLLNQHIWV